MSERKLQKISILQNIVILFERVQKQLSASKKNGYFQRKIPMTECYYSKLGGMKPVALLRKDFAKSIFL